MDLLEEYEEIIIPTDIVETKPVYLNGHSFGVSFDYRVFKYLERRYSEGKMTVAKRVKEITKEEYLKEIERMKEDIDKLYRDRKLIEDFINLAPKKKDGTFINGRILLSIPYEKTAMMRHFLYSFDWNYYVLKVKTTNDLNLFIEFDRATVSRC